MERPAYRSEDEREYLARGWWSDEDTLCRWLQKNVSARADRPAIVSSAGELTWRQLGERVSRVAAGLKKKGIDAGDVVALQLPNVAEFLIAHLAIARLGAVMCTLHMPYRGAEIETILAHSGAKIFIDIAFPFASLEDASPLP